jgi:hypothetical protein
VMNERTVDDARRYYAEEFLAARRGDPTPYMDGLRFQPPDGDTADPDQRFLSDDDLQRAQDEGKARSSQ